ncbi:MAG: acetyl-CoA carboxylase biotin carboxyl carrier protein [Saprospiraceae bacterium]|nr:acetyl-CoA carboxylase biotin carboxyl carrier protein [Saprospiraceae bacterium]
MNFKELQELIKLINKSNLTEFKYKKGDEEIAIRTKKYHKKKEKIVTTPGSAPIVHVPQPAHPVNPAGQQAPPPSTESKGEVKEKEVAKDEAKVETQNDLLEIKSPIVGTFYRSSSPDKPPFVKVGDRVEAGQVVCIVEAMKLFNEIESEISGEVVKVVAEDASPVEYDQVLFLIDPNK